MPDEWSVSVTRSAVRLQRRWAVSENPADRPARRGGGSNAGGRSASTAGRVIRDWSQRSRNTMRFEFSGLRWEELGRRPVMVTLTYPGDWQRWASSGPDVRRHVEAFKLRWKRKWGEPIRGVWVREFQERGAPHLHMYVGLPEGVSAEDYEVLVRRTKRTKLLQKQVGKFEARRSSGVLSVESEFGAWLTRAWSGCVGTPSNSPHAKFGADCITFFWSERAAEQVVGNENWGRVADYLWRESGKWGQKTVPEGFELPGRAWGKWGVSVAVAEAELDRKAAMELRRVLREVYVRRQRMLKPGRPVKLPRGEDGLTVFNLDKELALRLLRWAEGLAAEKTRAQAAEVGRSEAEADEKFCE